MSKISELSDGGSLVSSDYLIAVRSGGNVKVRMDQINVDQVDLGDNEFIRLGNSQDLTMVHTSTQSIINQAGIGDLLIQKAGTTKASITANGLEFPDNSKAIFGAGSDLQIYHDGSHSYVSDQGTGDLRILAADFRVRNAADDETMIQANADADVSLWYNNSKKLATTGTGIDITGTVTADGLTVVNDTDTQGKFSGWSVIGANSSSGAIELGQNSAYQGIMSYAADSSTRFLFDNTYGSTGSTFEFRTNTAATAKTHLKIGGSGDISFYEDTGTTPKFFWDASAESLGIGTSSPESGLHLFDGTNVRAPQNANRKATLTIEAGSEGSADIQMLNASYNHIFFGDAADANVGYFLYDHTNNSMQFATNAEERMRIDASGNLGIGVVPSADSFFKSLEIGNTGSGITGRGAADTHFMSGLIWDGNSTQEYTVSSVAVGKYQITNGIHYWATAPSGTAGAVATPQANMTLDASGNLLVGKTALEYDNTAGHIFRNDGFQSSIRSGGNVADFNRLSSDGEVIRLSKDGTTVGSIGTASSHLYIGNGTTNLLFHKDDNHISPWTGSAYANGTKDLGKSDARFKDLHLSTNIYQGTTTPSSSAAGVTTEALGRATYSRGSGIGGFAHLAFINGNGTVGTVTTSGSATAYNTSSDQRLKENIADADDAGAKIDSIQVRKFDWKVDGSHQDYGMVAQELLEVAPEAVSQGETEDDMMGVDYSKLVPMMLKEIQSLRARIAQLES